MFEVNKIDWNSDLVGFVLFLNDGRDINVQYSINQNRLDANYGSIYPSLILADHQHLNPSEEEYLLNFIKTNKTILDKVDDLCLDDYNCIVEK